MTFERLVDDAELRWIVARVTFLITELLELMVSNLESKPKQGDDEILRLRVKALIESLKELDGVISSG